MSLPKKKKAGGARKGAGRPKLKKRTKSTRAIYVTDWEYGRVLSHLRKLRKSDKAVAKAATENFS